MRIILDITALFLFSCKNDGHDCKWELCPYKGLPAGYYSKAVQCYTGEYNTVAYKVDMLHLAHPTLEYDQLDSLLTH